MNTSNMEDSPTQGLSAFFHAHSSFVRRKGKRVPFSWIRRRRAGPSSLGILHHKSIGGRRDLIEDIRCLYHDVAVRSHGEAHIVIDCEGKGPDPSPGDAGSVAAESQQPMIPGIAGNDNAESERPIPEAAVSAAASLLSSKKKRKLVCKLAGVEKVSEKIKAHLGIIAAALVSDMSHDLRGAVAKDPRIEQRCIMPRKKLEKEVLRKYKAEMREKRNDKLSLMSAVSKLSISGLSSKAYCTLRAVLNDMGMRGVLPTDKALRQTKAELWKLSMDDLQIFPTKDGWFVSPRAVVEMEILRLMQQGALKSDRDVDVGPDGRGWQDHFNVKITLDARRITKRTSQTEVMLLIIPKGQEGVDCCQKALSIRTIGIWMGKDSGANVQVNMGPFFDEIASLEKDGVWFCPTEKKLLGIWEKLSKDETTEALVAKGFRKVTLTFWHGADMAAQCAVLGQGCAGHRYCAHCNAHKNQRHIPYELYKVQEDINFQKLASEFDMFPTTLYAINAAADDTNVLCLSEDGLRACTKESEIREESVGSAVGRDAGVEQAMANNAGGGAEMRRPAKKRRGAGQTQARVTVSGVCKGPNTTVLKPLVGWKQHADSCVCNQCIVPANTVVRVIPKPSYDRDSHWLAQHWSSYKHLRFPFCALHCLMRITEAMFQMISQKSLKNPHVIDRLNRGLLNAGIAKQLKKAAGAGGIHFYERLTFEGHQAMKLLAKDEKTGEMAVVGILKLMWPSGDVDDTDGKEYVKKQTALWEQWSKVVVLMTERNPEKVDANQNGFSRFGKECREFCFRFQSMYHEEHTRSFYLHTLMHHAGDMMRELQEHGMCIGMMANSGAERRHEYGRRAAKKALAGGCWRKKIPELAQKQNIFAYLTLREVLLWQHGTDLVSHEMARRAVQECSAGSVQSRRTLRAEEILQDALLQLSPEQQAPDGVAEPLQETLQNLEKVDYPLPSNEEAKKAFDDVAEITHEYQDQELLDDLFVDDLQDGDEPRPGVVKIGNQLKYVIERDAELFQGRDENWDVLSQESAVGSDDYDEDVLNRARDLEPDNDGDSVQTSAISAPQPAPPAPQPASAPSALRRANAPKRVIATKPKRFQTASEDSSPLPAIGTYRPPPQAGELEGDIVAVPRPGSASLMRRTPRGGGGGRRGGGGVGSGGRGKRGGRGS